MIWMDCVWEVAVHPSGLKAMYTAVTVIVDFDRSRYFSLQIERKGFCFVDFLRYFDVNALTAPSDKRRAALRRSSF